MGLGKQFGFGKKGKISLSAEKPSYIAGELVRGTIFVTVHEPIQCDGMLYSMLKTPGRPAGS